MNVNTENIVEAINTIRQVPIYTNWGPLTQEIEVHPNDGLPMEQIISIQSKYDLVFSRSFRDFFKAFNGMYFFKYANCRIYDLATAVEDSIDFETMDKKLLVLGYFYDDQILMDCSSEENLMFYSLEGLEKPNPFDLSFEQFIRKCIEKRFEIFWADYVLSSLD